MMQELIKKSLKKRYRKEARFKMFGFASIAFAMCFLVIFFSSIFIKGYNGFFIHKIAVEIDLSKEKPGQLGLDYYQVITSSINKQFGENANFIKRNISQLADFSLREKVTKHPDLIGRKSQQWITLSSKADIYFKYKIAQSYNEDQIKILDELKEKSLIKKSFNFSFFTNADSREPEMAGVSASLAGSFLTIIIFLLFAFPIGVMCAFYLEEFAKKNIITDIIEISINNLAAIPSIIYGLLGLAVYLQYFNLPRSSALVGGMTLFMLVLPIIIIATRNAIRTIPQAIRDAAIALGASKVQVIVHHLFPLSIPGIMTGTILAVSRALGETAPLLMIGMVAFIADVPHGFNEPTTVLPVQIYLWSDSPEIGFVEKTSAAILVLLGLLILFNMTAIILRKKFEKKW